MDPAPRSYGYGYAGYDASFGLAGHSLKFPTPLSGLDGVRGIAVPGEKSVAADEVDEGPQLPSHSLVTAMGTGGFPAMPYGAAYGSSHLIGTGDRSSSQPWVSGGGSASSSGIIGGLSSGAPCSSGSGMRGALGDLNGAAPRASSIGNSPRRGRGTAVDVARHQHGDAQDEYFSVVIRVRPPLDRELESPVWQNVVSISNGSEVSLHEVIPQQETPSAGDRACGGAVAGQVVTNHAFTFDRVYDRDSSQPDVYSGSARAAALSTLQGYNATILAYGPTGTGKTYTMEGPRRGSGDDRGIIPRSMEEIFQHIKHCRGPQARFLVRASYLQIYNEVISDLLKPDRAHLVIREDRKKGVFVEGLSEWLCRSPSEVQTLMERGSTARATAHTAVNDASSRSHAVFIVIVEQSETLVDASGESERAAGQPPPATQLNQRVRVGRLNLVDLAGSERPRLTGAVGQRLEETKKINQSLSALGNVIAVLTERRPRQHIPYRDSKLTRLLEDSLGGNCRTTMMAMVSPAAEAFAESLSTLKFAHRAKAIRNTPQVNEDVDSRTLLRRYEAELKQLRAELKRRNESVVDPRQLLELEEERRRAEEDRAAAVSALEERSLVLEQEKASKRQLEERIRQMSSQLLVGGQQERIYSEYAAKLSELERERSTIEEDKAQVGRYKQLLLKQRDIMIALTQRLHERDETIIGLQDELDARDQRLAVLEELGDQRQAVDESRGGAGTLGTSGTAAAALSAGTGSAGPPTPPERLQYPPEDAVFDLHGGRPMQLLSAEEKVAELTALLDAQRQENHLLTLNLEEAQTQLVAAPAPSEAQRTVILSLADRISDVMLEVTGPPIAKLKITQDIMALKRLVSSGSATSGPGTPSNPHAFGVEATLRDAFGGTFTGSAAMATATTPAAAVGSPAMTPSSSLDVAAVAAVSAAVKAKRPSSPPGSMPRREGSLTPMSEGSFNGSTPRAHGLRGRRSLLEQGGESSRPRSLPSGRTGEKPLTVRRQPNGNGHMRSSSLGSVTTATAPAPWTGRRGGAASLKSSATVSRTAAVGSTACSTTASPLQEQLHGSASNVGPCSRQASAAASQHLMGSPCSSGAASATLGGNMFFTSPTSSLDRLMQGSNGGASAGVAGLGATGVNGLLSGYLGVVGAKASTLQAPGTVPAAASSGASMSSLLARSGGPVRAMPMPLGVGAGSMPSAFGGGASNEGGVDTAFSASWQSPARATSPGHGLPPATAAALASAALAARGAGSAPSPPAGLGEESGPEKVLAAESLREEAQRSVDALLARRKAELQRAQSSAGGSALAAR